jgi:ribosomal protein S18 acetylase RimI-like enzyme
MSNLSISYKHNTATNEDIYKHLVLCQNQFIPPLSKTVDIAEYSKKIQNLATTIEAWDKEILVGLVAVYCNDFSKKNAFITNVSVMPKYTGMGIAINLMNTTVAHVKTFNFESILLEVNKNNINALMLYKKCNFETDNNFEDIIKMKLTL